MSLFGLMLINQSVNYELILNFAVRSNIIISSGTTSTYNLFEDQVTLAGRVYTDAMLTNYFSSNSYGSKRVFAFAVIPIENFAPSGTTNDYFYPNFIPTNLWSYGDVGVTIVQAFSNDQCTSYDNRI